MGVVGELVDDGGPGGIAEGGAGARAGGQAHGPRGVAVDNRQLGRRRGVHGADELGAYLLYIFFFVIGLRADLLEVIRNVPVLFVFCLVMAVTNLLFTLSVGKLLKLNLEELLLSVNATLGGAPSAGAMAISRGWTNLVLPGILAGIWGYVIGTFIGIVVTESLMRLL